MVGSLTATVTARATAATTAAAPAPALRRAAPHPPGAAPGRRAAWHGIVLPTAEAVLRKTPRREVPVTRLRRGYLPGRLAGRSMGPNVDPLTRRPNSGSRPRRQ